MAPVLPSYKLFMLNDLWEVAERQGFEPWIPCGIHAFQACAFSHSAISPHSAESGWALLNLTRLAQWPKCPACANHQTLHAGRCTIGWPCLQPKACTNCGMLETMPLMRAH